MNWAFEFSKKYKPKAGLADIYGVVLYTDAHPYIKKVLADDDNWKALNEISGDLWAIFSIKPLQGKYGNPSDTFSSEFMEFMVPVWKEPNENKTLLNEFQLESTEDLPLLLVFTQDNDGEILKLTFKIDEDSLENAYNSLRKIIEVITKAIEYVSPEYRKSPSGVFQAVKINTDSFITIEKIKKGIKFYSWIKKIFP